MLNNGDKVRIVNVGNVFEGKEGILEQVIQDDDSTMCTVFVDFLPEEGKKIRQNFDIANVEFLNEGKNKNNKKPSTKNNKGNNNKEQQPEEPKEYFDTSKLIPLDDELAIGEKINEFQGYKSCQFKVYCSDIFCEDLDGEKILDDQNMYGQFLSGLASNLGRMTFNGTIMGSKKGSDKIDLIPDRYKLYEMRIRVGGNNPIRIIYGFKNGVILLTHLFYKNTPDIPYSDKQVAMRVYDSCLKTQNNNQNRKK